MHAGNIKPKKNIVIAFCFIVLAWGMRLIQQVVEFQAFPTSLLTLFRTYIYFAIFIFWGLSLKKRIVQTSTRRKLWIMAISIIGWLFVRTVKYTCVVGVTAMERYCWYLYYVPMVIIPLMGLFAAMSFNKPEDYRIPGWCYSLYIVATLLIIMVLTNDLHQLVFVFHSNPFSETDYSYGIAYMIIVAYIFILVLVTYAMILFKSRSSKNNRGILVPVFFMVITLGYVVCYAFRMNFIYFFFGDMTVYMSVMAMCLWESYIQTGMIPVNSKYRELMEASEGISFQILDVNKKLKFKSRNVADITQQNIADAEKHPVMLENNIKLSHSDISYGHVLWQEDVSEIIALNEKLEEMHKLLEDDNLVAREKYNSSLRRHRLEEQNRLYDKMQRETESQITSIMGLVEYCETEPKEADLRQHLALMTVLGAYLKRRSNLLVLGDTDKYIKAIDLERCFDESLNNIRILCPYCGMKTELPEEIEVAAAIQLYDFFEESIEKVRTPLEAVFVRLFSQNGRIAVRLVVETETQITEERDDDGAQTLTFFAREDGDATC